jgi:hypothetical protein
MKKLLLIFVLIALGFSLSGPSSAFAQDEATASRTVNPGEDPNEAKSSKPLEAEAATMGNCNECLARLKHTRLGDDTTFRPTAGAASGSATPSGSTREGTR